MDGDGNITTPFNTVAMSRGWIDQTGAVTTHIFAADGDVGVPIPPEPWNSSSSFSVGDVEFRTV
jgi:hypothetical protein